MKFFKIDDLSEMNRNKIFIFFSLFILSFISCGKSVPDSPIIATVNGEPITVDDFYEEARNVPARRVLNVGAAVKHYKDPRDILNMIIELEIVVAEARNRGLDKTEEFKKLRKSQLDEETMWQLYEEKVYSATAISEIELRNEYLRQNQKIKIRHLFSKNKNEILGIQNRLKSGEGFDSIAKELFRDPVLSSNGGDLGWLEWGEWDASFEEAAWELAPGETSEPVRTRFGWHLIKMDDRQQNIFITEDGFREKYSSLQKDVHRRKAKKLSDDYVNELMSSKTPIIDKDSFVAIADYMGEVMSRRGKVITENEGSFSDPELRNITIDFTERLDDRLVSWNNGNFTIGHFMEYLNGLSPKKRKITGAQSLNRKMWKWIRDRLLTEEAYRLGLDKSDRVKKEVTFWEDNYLMNTLLTEKSGNEPITKEMISKEYDSFRKKYSTAPMVNVREILLTDSVAIREVMMKIEEGEDFSELAKTYSERDWAAVNGGELGYFRMGQFKPIDKFAFKAKAGEIIGPFEVGSKYSIIKVIGKKGREPISLEQVSDQIRREILLRRRTVLYPEYVTELRKKYDIVMDADLFAAEVVSSKEWSEVKGAISNLFVMDRR